MPTILAEANTFDNVKSPNPGEPGRAGGGVGIAETIEGDNGDVNGGVTYTALLSGVRVRHLGGISQTLGCTHVGNDITVQLGTDAMGVVTSDANDVKAEVDADAGALVSTTVTGTGAGLAGINTFWVQLANGILGSIRTGLQNLTNRTKFLYTKVYGLLLGTLTVKSLRADGTGDNAAVPVAGQIRASNGFWASGGNVDVDTGNINVSAGNVDVSDEVACSWLDLSLSRVSITEPSPDSFIEGQQFADTIVFARCNIKSDGTYLGGANIYSVTRTAAGVYEVVTLTCPAAYSGLADNTQIDDDATKAGPAVSATIMSNQAAFIGVTPIRKVTVAATARLLFTIKTRDTGGGAADYNSSFICWP